MNILNKVCKTSIAFILGVSLIGCAPKKESATTHTVNDGNYTGIGTGYNGYVTVSASFRNWCFNKCHYYRSTRDKSSI